MWCFESYNQKESQKVMTIHGDILKFSLIVHMYPLLKDIRGIMYLENAWH